MMSYNNFQKTIDADLNLISNKFQNIYFNINKIILTQLIINWVDFSILISSDNINNNIHKNSLTSNKSIISGDYDLMLHKKYYLEYNDQILIYFKNQYNFIQTLIKKDISLLTYKIENIKEYYTFFNGNNSFIDNKYNYTQNELLNILKVAYNKLTNTNYYRINISIILNIKNKIKNQLEIENTYTIKNLPINQSYNVNKEYDNEIFELYEYITDNEAYIGLYKKNITFNNKEDFIHNIMEDFYSIKNKWIINKYINLSRLSIYSIYALLNEEK